LALEEKFCVIFGNSNKEGNVRCLESENSP
jgi:hypothetical protein